VPELDPIPPRNSWKADVRIEADIVTKSFERNSAVPRWMGRWFLNREQRALQRLDGLDGVPRFISRPGPYRLCMTRVDGIPLRNCYERGISEAFFADLVRLFDAMHGRGVGHGDAHHRNILVAGDRAGLIDFSVAHVTRDPERRSGRVFQWYLALDQRALYKVENGFLHRGSPPEMFMLYRLAKRFQSHH
jgi:tRNA A-37 threonylcarbamoyl transferase component Bud32